MNQKGIDPFVRIFLYGLSSFIIVQVLSLMIMIRDSFYPAITNLQLGRAMIIFIVLAILISSSLIDGWLKKGLSRFLLHFTEKSLDLKGMEEYARKLETRVSPLRGMWYIRPYTDMLGKFTKRYSLIVWNEEDRLWYLLLPFSSEEARDKVLKNQKTLDQFMENYCYTPDEVFRGKIDQHQFIFSGSPPNETDMFTTNWIEEG